MKTQALVSTLVHALVAGTHYGQSGTVSITPEHIQQIAESYSPELHEAPAVLGHPATDDPAYGWVSAAAAKPDGLWLNVDLLPEFADTVRNRQYKKVSVSLYNPNHPANPTPGRYHLKHLGFLGAQPPAVKGLKPIALADAVQDTTVIEFQEQKEPVMDEEETNLAEKESQLAQREAALAERERKVKRAEIEAKLTPHITAGRLLPAQKALFVELMERAGDDTVSLSEGEAAKPLADKITDYLSGLPAQVNLQEVSAPTDTENPPVSNFSAPNGFSVDSERAALDAKVQAWLSQNHGKTYVEALSALGVA